MTSSLPSILLVGCGNMGGAMLKAWLKGGLKPSVIVDRHLENLPQPHLLVRSVAEIPPNFKPDVTIIAVKPQKADPVLLELSTNKNHISVILSVMAGRTIESIRKVCAQVTDISPSIIRTIPNTPSSIGAGITPAFAPHNVSQKAKDDADKLLCGVGESVWLDKEEQIDPACAISGSGPAYLFLLAELLQKAGEEHGLSPDIAAKLGRETIYGAGKMMHVLPESATTLRKNVTSPGGTTAAALSVYMRENAWPATVSEAITVAVKRAKELSSS